MSAIQLLEQLGASALHQRGGSAETAVVREQALQAMESIEQPIKQWCIVVPAEDEDGDTPSEGDDETKDEIRLN